MRARIEGQCHVVHPVPALPWKMGTLSSFWELKRSPFPRIFSAILPPFCVKTRRNQSLNLSPFPWKARIFSEILQPFHVKTEKSGLKFTPFFKSNQIKLELNIFILNRYGPTIHWDNKNSSFKANFIALFKISMRIWIRPLIWWFHKGC